MPDPGCVNSFIQLFPAADIPRILQCVQNALPSLVRPDPACKRPEEDLSKQLFLRLCALPEFQTGPLEPHLESWLVRDTGTTPTVCGRADIRFSCGRGVETYFAIEAKRLYVQNNGKTRNLTREYLDDGMMRFVSGYYAPTQEAGAMLGYIFTTEIAKVEEALAKQISATVSKLHLTAPWQVSTLSVTPPVAETRHAPPGRNLTIYHLLTELVAVAKYVSKKKPTG